MSYQWPIRSLLCSIMIVLAAMFQSQLFLSPDVGYLLHAGNQLLNGGNYVSDFLETNPPMILYLYIPACLFAKYLSINIVFAVKFYIFSLVIFSLVFSFYLLKKIIKTEDHWYLYFFTFLLSVVLLFLPLFEFGQREHLFLILTLPYYFASVMTLENKSNRFIIAMLIGILAGIGISLKPFFLLPFGFIELYIMMQKKSFFAWLRVEPVFIIIVILAYLGISWFFYFPYFHTILPLVFHFYFPATKNPWVVILTDPLFGFCMAAWFSYFLFFTRNSYQSLNSILWLALTGMIIAFLIPRSDWFYHILPALSMGALLIGSCVSQMFFISGLRTHYLILGLIGVTLIFIIPLAYTIDYVNQFIHSEWFHTEKKLAETLKLTKGKHSIYCVSTRGTSDCFPLVYDSDSQFAGRFPFLWWYPGLKKLENQQKLTDELFREKKFLIEAFSADLNQYQANSIIVNTGSFTDWETENRKLATENKLYREAWSHYHYFTTIGRYQIFTRDKMDGSRRRF